MIIVVSGHELGNLQNGCSLQEFIDGRHNCLILLMLSFRHVYEGFANEY